MNEGSAVVPCRTPTQTSANLKKPESRDPAEMNDRLGRNRAIEQVIKHLSGMGANTSTEFHDTYALYKGIEALGLDVSIELKVMEEKARISGDEGGKNKLQIVQMLEEKQMLFPGAGTMYPQEVPDPGIIAKFFSIFTGKKPGAQ
jgi:hypothetical protein